MSSDQLRQSQHFRRWRAPTDEHTHAGHKVLGSLTRSHQSKSQLLSAANTRFEKNLHPLLLGSFVRRHVRPCLLPGKKDRAQFAKETVDHLPPLTENGSDAHMVGAFAGTALWIVGGYSIVIFVVRRN